MGHVQLSSLDLVIYFVFGGTMAYETAFFSFTWIEDWKDPKNSKSAYVTGLNKKGWRLIQVKEQRRKTIFLRKKHVENSAYVVRYDKVDDPFKEDKRWKYYSEQSIDPGTIPYKLRDNGWPVGNEIIYEFIMERQK